MTSSLFNFYDLSQFTIYVENLHSDINFTNQSRKQKNIENVVVWAARIDVKNDAQVHVKVWRALALSNLYR